MEFNRPITRMDGWKNADESLPGITEFADPVDPERIQKGYFGNLKGKLFTNLPADQAGVSLHYDDPGEGGPLLIKIGISHTSLENARNNLAAECSHWDFDRVVDESRDEWNDWLGKIDVKGGATQTRVKFYTDLWHALLGRHKIDDHSGDYPTCFAPKDAMKTAIVARGTGGYIQGDYDTQTPPRAVIRSVPRGSDGKPLHHMYNSDALWLTMWNQNILWGLGWPGMMDEFSVSMLEYARHGGCLPRGPSGGGYTGIMRGCPATSLITAT
jgi:putative alpha-1,2-mannosidase